MRDDNLELKVDGQKITANQYLENCLALKRGRNQQVIQNNGNGNGNSNGLRETIRAFF